MYSFLYTVYVVLQFLLCILRAPTAQTASQQLGFRANSFTQLHTVLSTLLVEVFRTVPG